MRFRAEVEVFLKPGLLDPQGKAIAGSLPALGWTNVSDVRVGKAVALELEAADEAAASAQVAQIAERLLANPVIERYLVRGVTEVLGRDGNGAG